MARTEGSPVLVWAAIFAGLGGLVAGATASGPHVEGMMQEISRMRGHEYRERVRAETLTEGRVRSFLLRKLHEEYPPQRLEAERRTMVHFGFLEPDDDLEGLFVAMLSDQAAGYYDPDTQRLILVKGKLSPGMALVHELVHALQDQTFGIRRILDRARGNDDEMLAAQAMIEGEATLHTERYVDAHGAGEMGEAAPDEPKGRSTPRIPRALQRTFIFPYVEGLAWARSVDGRGGNRAMDEVFRRPPESTEQILHPEKMAPERDLPSTFDPGILESLAVESRAAGYRPLRSDTMGEFLTRELLGSGDPAAHAASGWDGDLYAVYEDGSAKTAMVWITAWDSPADALEFHEEITRWLGRRPGAVSSVTGRAGEPSRIVWIIEGFSQERAGRIEAALLRALRSGVTFR